MKLTPAAPGLATSADGTDPPPIEIDEGDSESEEMTVMASSATGSDPPATGTDPPPTGTEEGASEETTVMESSPTIVCLLMDFPCFWRKL